MRDFCLPFSDDFNIIVAKPYTVNQQRIAVKDTNVIQVFNGLYLQPGLNLVVFRFGFGGVNLEKHAVVVGGILGCC